MLIPIKFAEYGGDTSQALSQFGIIRGMAIPILFFPFAFLGSLASIALPEITRLNVAADKRERDAKISKLLSVSFLFGIGTGALFFFFPKEISVAMYKTDEAAEAIRVLAAVTPFMYVETVTDSLLKSIGEQFGTFTFSIYNSALRIGAIMLVIPHTGATGYLWLLVASNIFSFLLCVLRLAKVSGWRPFVMADILLPVCASVAAGYVCRYVLLLMKGTDYRIGMCVILVLFVALYGAVCFGAEKWKKA
jgi:stage V sporulation protein B